jgi:hypothetical protein
MARVRGRAVREFLPRAQEPTKRTPERTDRIRETNRIRKTNRLRDDESGAGADGSSGERTDRAPPNVLGLLSRSARSAGHTVRAWARSASPCRRCTVQGVPHATISRVSRLPGRLQLISISLDGDPGVTITATCRRVLASLVATAAISPSPAGGQTRACTGGPPLPAYAHNDYANPHPLSDALELRYRGVEADVLLRGGELRVAHAASETRPGRNLEALYLRPLRTIVHQCGHVLAPSTPFLLNIELKERSRAGYDSLIALLQRYADLLEPPDPRLGVPPVEIILVGWYPLLGDSTPDPRLRLWRQQRITSLSPSPGPQSTIAVRLVSLDYGKTIGWSGRGPLPARAAGWLARLRAVKGEGPGRLARAYNVPIDPAVYRLLLEAGVDLIGTKRLVASREVLLTLGAAPGRPLPAK